MALWLDPQPIAVPEPLRAAVGGHPLVAQVLARRGLSDAAAAQAFLHPSLYRPAPPTDLPGLEQAMERIEQAMGRGQRVAVWGDFDVDGQTATTVLVQCLRALGGDVLFHIPVRADEGHGVNLPWLQRLIDQGVGLVVTCDTGVAAHEAVDYARQRGVEVVITDHHDLPPTLPAAAAVVNPKLLPDSHPLSALPGVGVAYKVAEALLGRAGRAEVSQDYLDLAALGIVADLALLTGDTRCLAQLGLSALRRTGRLGLRAMMELAGLNAEHLTEEHVAFALAPRLNALGRLADANEAVELLTTHDLSRARVLATQLEGLNAKRQALTAQILQAALAQIERDPTLLDYAALVLAHPSWPAGVIGIVASQLVERFRRPVVLLAAPPGELARGSARSVEGCNITAAIAAQAPLLAGFGGHPMAAGLAIAAERIPEFRRALSRTVQAMAGEKAGEPTLAIDATLPLADLSLALVDDLERLAPFGPGNPPPVLAAPALHLAAETTVGRNREHRLVTVVDGEGATQQVIWWNGAIWPLPDDEFDLAYTVRASTYRGERRVQVVWLEARLAAAPVVVRRASALTIVDLRGEVNALARLEEARRGPSVQVWCEAEARQALAGQDRGSLEPADTLVVWTTPPSRRELLAAVQRVAPRTVVLFGVDPEGGTAEAFLGRLAGLVKRALSAHQGQARLSVLAAATAQSEAAVRLGIDWLAARGFIVVEQTGDELRLAAGDGRPSPQLPQVAAALQSALAETAAYRAYFARAEAASLF